MTSTVQKWGNSLALRLPREVVREAQIHQGTPVDIVVSGKKIVLEPRKTRRYSLRQLVGRITKSSIHSEQSWGAVRGREVW
jgi:antitoxin MazE